ncbi:hypothetical protein [Pantoea dispersa]|nr:hypothetical protein [Pantoea dispersa]
MQTRMPVGIDVASGKFDVAVWKGDTSYKTKVFPNTCLLYTSRCV